MPKKKPAQRVGIRAADVPVTQKMLYGVRDQLQCEMSAMKGALQSEMLAMKGELQSEMLAMKSELRSEMSALKTEVKSDIHELKVDVQFLKSEMSGVRGEIHRLAILVEEQNAKNNIVLDGLTSLFHRQDRLEFEIKDLRAIVLELKR